MISRTTDCIWILDPNASCQQFFIKSLSARFELSFFARSENLLCALNSVSALPQLLIVEPVSSEVGSLDVLSALKSYPGCTFPCLVVTQTENEQLIRRWFGDGAMDCLVKPVSSTELIVKVDRALAARRGGTFGELVIHPFHQMVTLRDSSVELTRMETRILARLKKTTPGAPVSRKALEAFVWRGSRVGSRTLDVHFHNLRKKLRSIGTEIHYVSGQGYFLEDPHSGSVGSTTSTMMRCSI